MRSFGSARRRLMMTAAAVSVYVCAIGAQAPASTKAAPAGPAPTAKVRYETATENDEKVRILLTNMRDATPLPDLVKQVNQVVASFETLVRRFPTSGYADNALWHAASLADTAYQRFKRPEDLNRATKLYRWLVKEYPTSPLLKQANAKLASLTRAPAPAMPAPPAVPPASPAGVTAPAPSIAANAPPPAAPAPALDAATLTGIQRMVLPEAVRVTLELDHEVAYHEERIAGPERLFFDLKNVQVVPALKDKVLSYPSDVVSKIRVGRHPDSTVRVVLDFEEVTKYSVFTLYNPFRLVIDAERGAARVTTTTAAAPPPDPKPATVVVPAPETPKLIVTDPVAPPPSPAPVVPAASGPSATTTPAPASPASNAAGGYSIARQLGLSVSRIVIDPGHGGHDPGTLAKGLNESALTLDVALRLEKLLQKEAGVEVVLTRRTDVYVPLEERTAIANRANADLFLSIHANSSRNAEARGIESYYLSFASSPEAEAVAARENSASEREMHQLPDMIKAIALNNKLDESKDLANMVQASLVSTLRKSNKNVRSRGVKKAPFVVLIGAQMPSVLAEISFLTNKQELQLLKTNAYKDKIAQSLYGAVLQYRRSLKGTATLTVER